MRNSLYVSKMCCVDEKLFFFTEDEDVFGKICIKTGDVFLYENTPEELLCKRTYNNRIVNTEYGIFIIGNNGTDIYEFNGGTASFKKIETDAQCVIKGGWAGFICDDEKIYAFAREEGKLLIIDTKSKVVNYLNTNIKEKLMWVCNTKNSVYALSWNCSNLYEYDLSTQKVTLLASNMFIQKDLISKTIIPIHGMCGDAENVFFHDARRIFKYNLITKQLLTLWENKDENNGSRLIMLDNSLVMPLANQKKYYTIGKEDGSIHKIKELPKDILLADEMATSGEPCYAGKNIYLMIMGTNKILKIEKDTGEFSWITLKSIEEEIRKVVLSLSKANITLIESPIFVLPGFIKTI